MTDPRTSRRARLALVALSIVALGAALPAASLAQDEPYEPPHDEPGPAADRLLYNSFFVDRAPLDIEAGNMDLYLFGLKTEAAEELRGTEGIELIDAPATTVSLILNPAPAPEGELNPFSIPEIRRAMQYLVNRESIAQDIYRGAARRGGRPGRPGGVPAAA
jgi:peptide/nickel transport system substrate-binding protein